jgi:mono/diheme cytochrome c family protein
MFARSLPLRALGALLLVLAVLIAGCGGDDDAATFTEAPPSQTQNSEGSSQTDDGGGAAATADGAELFEQRCGSCHTLAAAGTSGQIGPNLDELGPDEATVRAAIEEGPSSMPPNLYEGAEADAVAAYVAENAGR